VFEGSVCACYCRFSAVGKIDRQSARMAEMVDALA
jgi:hypothetical protein